MSNIPIPFNKFFDIRQVRRAKVPTFRQWKYLPKVLQAREKWLIRGLFLLIIVSILVLNYGNYLFRVRVAPQVGGQYTEGILGQPRFINPVLAQTNDADRDLVQLVYSSLFKYDSQGSLIPDLAESYHVEDEGLTYRIRLKQNIVWHDGEPLTADDVLFTIKTIQDAEYKSPLRNNWQGVQVEKINDLTIVFRLNNVYAPFLHNLVIAVLPQHLWGGISAQNFALAQYNLKPVGSGPYKFKEFAKDENGKIKSIELTRNENYYLPTPTHIYSELDIADETIQGPFIKKIIFKFYDSQDVLIEAFNKGRVNGMNFVSAARQTDLKGNVNVYEIDLPAYYAVFFNQEESKVLSNRNIRLALSYAVNKDEIVEKILQNKGTAVHSPILSGWSGFGLPAEEYEFDIEKARDLLEGQGWKDIDEDGIREKGSGEEEIELAIELVTTDWPELEQTALLLKEQWERAGVRVDLKIADAASIQQEHIRPRQYEALLFGEVLSADPDPFAFWHSSQGQDPGLNLSLYQNQNVDKLLEDARQMMDEEKRNEKYGKFQEQIIEDIPAVFLYSAVYLYPVQKSIRGISLERLAQHSYRFSQVESWYIKTKLVWE